MTRTRSRVTRLLLGLTLAALSIVFSIGMAELALRTFDPQPPSWLAIYRRHPALPFHALQPDVHASIDTGETSWSVATDASGFRVGRERKPAPCTAVWLGDSFAFGHGVDYEDSFVGLADAGQRDVAQVNTAVPGYGPVQYREILEYLVAQRRHFDFVFVAIYVGNDFHDTIWNKDVVVNDGVLGHERDLKSYLKANVHLYRLATAVYHRLAPVQRSPYEQAVEDLANPDVWANGVLAPALERFTKEVSLIQQIGRENGAEVRFLIIPTDHAVRARRGEATQSSGLEPLLPVEKARQALEATGAEVFDATDALAELPVEEVYFPFDGHLTPKGNRIVYEGWMEARPVACPGRTPSP